MTREEYLREYHKSTYQSDTSKRDSKTHIMLGRLLTTLSYLAKNDAGKHFSVSMTSDEELKSLVYDGWSDALVINQENLSVTIDTTKMSISRYITKAEELDYVKTVGKLRLSNSKYDSTVIIVNLNKVYEDFSEIYFEEYQSLGNSYYKNIEVKEKSKLLLNDKCMQESLWQDLKIMIEKDNIFYKDDFKVKFLTLGEDGHYHDSRFYSSICKTLNPERHKDSDRYEKLREIFEVEDEHFIEIDVNSMMLRTSYDLLNEEPLAQDKDVYYELYLKMTSTPMDRTNFRESGARDFIKQNIMSIYMDPRSVYCRLKNNCVTDLNVVKNNFENDEVERIFGMSFADTLTLLKESLYQFLSVYDYDGDKRVFFGSMFFKYEAIVYYYMHKIFREKGIKTTNVYDGFYFIDGTCDEDLFYNAYHESILKTKSFLKLYNHDLVKLYGKDFTLKHRIFTKKTVTKKTKEVTYSIESKHVDDTERLNAREIAITRGTSKNAVQGRDFF